MTKKVKFIYNPSSGDSRVAYSLDDIISIYQRKGFTIIPFRLTFDYDDDDIVEGLDDSYHHVLIAGGDGTINHIVNLLKSAGLNIPIAVLPTGTANDFATMLGMPSDITSACKKILSGEIAEVDLGKVNGKYFINVFSCGLFTDASQRTPSILKNTFGKLAYYFSSLQELPNFKKLQLTVQSDGKVIYAGKSLLFLVFNGKTAGNLKIAYLSNVQDGLLDVLILPGDNIVETIRTVAHYLRRDTHSYPKDVVHVKSNNIRITSLNDEITDIDGQPGPSFPVEITCEPKALRIICPKQKNGTLLDMVPQ